MLDYPTMTDTSNETGTYDPFTVEARWRERWEERRTNAVDVNTATRPYYNLMMFPYPSAEGLHVGNVFAFVGADIHGRFRRLQGWDVFEPLGFDAFGIHSENFALKVNTHPAKLIPANIARFREQLKRTGLMIDWDHEVSTTDPEYYKWTQWIFLKLYEAGEVVKKLAPVNWCPECKTVLANEQVEDGYCERHPGVRVHQKSLSQWFFKITEHAERLLQNLSDPGLVGLDEIDADQLDRSLGGGGVDIQDARRTLRSRSTPPGPTPCLVRPTWCSRRNIRWWMRSPAVSAGRKSGTTGGRPPEGHRFSAGGRQGEDRCVHGNLRAESRYR